MSAMKTALYWLMTGSMFLLMALSGFLLVFFSLPVSYEMWLGDIRPGERIFGDGFAPTFAGALSGVAIEAVLIVFGAMMLRLLWRARLTADKRSEEAVDSQ